MLSDVLNDALLDTLDYVRKYPFYNKFGDDIREMVDRIIHLKGLLDVAPEEKPYQYMEQSLLDWQIILFETISNILYLAPTMIHDGRQDMADHSLRLVSRLFDTYYNPQKDDAHMGDHREPGQPMNRSEAAAEKNAEEMNDAAEEIDDENTPEPVDTEQIIIERETERAEKGTDSKNASEGGG